ncbi:non-ribosomal peptide synthetase component F [Streptomyces ambofaciens]
MTPGHGNTGSTVDGMLRRSARRTPARVAVEYRDRSWTYEELDTAVSRAASVLLAEGLSPGDRVGAYGHNSDAYLIAFLACARAGLVQSRSTRTSPATTSPTSSASPAAPWSSPIPASPPGSPAGPAPCRCATPPTRSWPDSPRRPRTTAPNRAPRTWCNCSTPPAPPRCPRAR